MSSADKNKLAYIGSKPGFKDLSRESDAWFTPVFYIELAKEVMGDIDLDPFSSEAANQRIKAKRYFSIENDAFQNEWFREQGRVFMNPPYTRNIIDASVQAFLTNLTQEKVNQGIVLVNNATETKWFQALLKECAALCLPDRRIAFENIDGKNVSGNTRGQVFFYFGHKLTKFIDIFSKIGTVVLPTSRDKN